jgi:hypothetical protein
LYDRYASAFAHAHLFTYAGICLEQMAGTEERAQAFRSFWGIVQHSPGLRRQPPSNFLVPSDILLLVAPPARLAAEPEQAQWRTQSPTDDVAVQRRFLELRDAVRYAADISYAPRDELLRLAESIRDPATVLIQLRLLIQAFAATQAHYPHTAPFVRLHLKNPAAEDVDYVQVWHWINDMQDPVERLQALTDFVRLIGT